MKKSGFVSDFVKPVLVLFAIAAVVALVLATVNSLTAPVIEENDRIAAEEKRTAALPLAATFRELDLSPLGIEGVESGFEGYSAAGEKVGYVFTASFQGYGGPVVSTVGMDCDGKVLSVLTDIQKETSGVGSKCGKEEFTKRFDGLTDASLAVQVDGISGASRTSNAVKKGVQAAMEARKAVAPDSKTAGGEGK